MKWQRIWRTNEWNISNWGRGSLLGAELGKLSVKCGADLGYLAFQMHFPLFVAQLQNNPGWESPGRFGPFEFWSLPMGPAPASNPLETLGGIFKGIRGCWTLVSLRLFTSPQISVSPEFSPDVTGRGKHAWGYIGWMGTGEMLVCSSKAFWGIFSQVFHICAVISWCVPEWRHFPIPGLGEKSLIPTGTILDRPHSVLPAILIDIFLIKAHRTIPRAHSFMENPSKIYPIIFAPSQLIFHSSHPIPNVWGLIRNNPAEKKTKKKLTGKISVMFCHSGKHEQALWALKQQ